MAQGWRAAAGRPRAEDVVEWSAAAGRPRAEDVAGPGWGNGRRVTKSPAAPAAAAAAAAARNTGLSADGEVPGRITS